MDALTLFSEGFDPPHWASDCPVCIPSLTGAADAFLAMALAQGRVKAGDARAPAARVVLAVTPGMPDADRLADDLKTLTAVSAFQVPAVGMVRVLELPPRLDSDKSALGMRLKTLAALRAWSLDPYPCVVVASSSALAAPVRRTAVAALSLPGLSFGALCGRLVEFGYERRTQVAQEGDFSVRGGIVDVWCPGEELPVRAEFFGDDLESLRSFDVVSQTSVSPLKEAFFVPARENAGAREGESDTVGFLDLLPDSGVVLAFEHNEYTLEMPGGSGSGRRRARLYTGDPAPRDVPSYAFQTTALPGFAELGADESHHPELFDAARRRLEQHLSAADHRGDVILRLDDLSGGFEMAASAPGRPGLLVVSKADRVFAKRFVRSTRSAPSNAGVRLNDFDDLEPGEYVVHVDYGVGRYLGSSEIATGDSRREVYTIEYAEGARLHVPAAHAHLLSRYVGVKGASVRLHRLDGTRWSKDKADAQKAVSDLAASLLETQARRETVPGYSCDVNCDGIEAFEAAFPYEETPDQAAAIAAVKRDLAARKPMDRLICGDAGYGKTEVAMRAAYIMAMNGRQVAVLAPTTILAEQHFETFTSRFDGTPVRIESMSRFQSSGTHRGTFQRLATGVCDIVIGTHAILSKKMAFRDLGLIIVDEEQRFGVRQKEFLKRLRATADVLTLSATPIPRTLYLSMIGVRDLSLLRSPPRERVAVDIKIVTDSDEVIATAIDAELARGGQVFFLHNRVTTIGRVEKRLEVIFARRKAATGQPVPRIVVAHGQMDTRTLAHKMRDFEQGRYDILLSTTIVESGIDIPRANTILVDHAEMFGLSDLYQLRGRVGRCSRQGYAVFLLPTGGCVDSDARERLQALKRHGALGGGFNLAVRDLELRGAGNLLGSQQSGHIAAIGFSLYCQLLQRTVAQLKGEKVREIVDVRLNFDFIDFSSASDRPDAAAALPYDYVEEDVQRMSFMKRLGEASDDRVVRALEAELKDRFGPLPPAAKRLVRMTHLRVACAAAGYGIVDVRGNRAIFYKAGSREMARDVDLRGATADRKLSELLAVARHP